jgi:hypothetical protein
MAGYASQNDYEADLLQTYLRKGRVSPITRRDVDLALSIYRMPKSRTDYKNLAKLTSGTAKKAAKGLSDSQLMSVATTAVLNKAIDTKKQAAAAKAAAAKQQAAARAAASLTTAAAPRRTAVPPPIAPRSSGVPYFGPLTPPTAPRTSGQLAPTRSTSSTSTTTTRKPRTGYSIVRPI